MIRRAKQQRRRNLRRQLTTEQLEGRRLLATLDMLPGSGIMREVEGVTHVVVQPGATIRVTAQVDTSGEPVQGFQLNLSQSSSQLTIDNFTNGTEFPVSTDTVLDSTEGDYFVSSAFIGALPVPPPRPYGTFDVTVPTTPGSYTLTGNFTTGTELTNTLLTNAAGDALPLTNFGDLVFDVLGSGPTVSFGAATQTVSEDGGVVTIPVTLSAASTTNVAIPFSLSGSAVKDSDYTVTASPITIAAGQTTANIQITITDDNTDGETDQVIVTLGSPTGATLGATTVFTLNITDNDFPAGTTATFDLIPAATAGTVTTENGKTVVTVAPGTKFNVTAQVQTADKDVQGFQLNFSNSDSELLVNNFALGTAFPVATDQVINSAANDYYVASAFIGALPVPPPRVFGTFDVTAPATVGDYTLTADFDTGTELTNTLLTDIAGNTLNLTDFGDLIVRVAAVAAPTVTVNAASQSVSENAGAVTIQVNLSAASTSAVTVPFTLSGTATSGTDFTASTSPLTIPAGQTSANITITVIDDALVESAPDTVIVTLGTPTGATLGAGIVHTITINDNDTTAVKTAAIDLVPGSGTITTENGKTVVTVAPGTKLNVSAQVVSSTNPVQGYQLNFSTSSTNLLINNFVPGAAFPNNADSVLNSAANDFFVAAAFTGELPVPPPRVFGTFDVTAPNTNGDYPLSANFTTGTELTNTIITNIDGDKFTLNDFGDLIVRVQGTPIVPVATINTATQSVEENVGTVRVTVSLSAASTTPVSIPFTLSGTAASPGDYTSTASPLTIPAGQTSADITITVVNDSIEEGDETIIVILGTPTGANLGTAKTQTITIKANDTVVVTPPTVSISTANQSVAENGGARTVTLTLSKAATTAVTIPFAVSGNATSGDDFTISASPVTIAAGATTGTITITPKTDSITEPNETVVITLGSPTGATLGSATTHTLTITDATVVTPTNPVVTISGNPASTDEGGSFTVTVSFSKASTSAVTVPFTVSGSATSPSDFTIGVSSVTIPAGATSATFQIVTIDDTIDEADQETVIVTLGTPTGGADLGDARSFTAIIIDNDGVPTIGSRVISPNLIAGPKVIPGDGLSTTIIFGVLRDTMLTVKQIGGATEVSRPQIGLFTESLTPIGTESRGLLESPLKAGKLYALVFAAATDRKLFTLQSSAGYDVLVQTLPTNFVSPTDVNGSGETTSMDALMVINRLNVQGNASGEDVGVAGRYYDVNGDGNVTALDALRVINQLQLGNGSKGSGELISSASDEGDSSRVDQVIADRLFSELLDSRVSTFDSISASVAQSQAVVAGSQIDDVDDVMAELEEEFNLLF